MFLRVYRGINNNYLEYLGGPYTTYGSPILLVQGSLNPKPLKGSGHAVWGLALQVSGRNAYVTCRLRESKCQPCV